MSDAIMAKGNRTSTQAQVAHGSNDDADRFFARALTSHRGGDIHKAVGDYTRAIAAQPDHADALNNLGVALRALGRDGEAAAVLRRAIQARPRQADFHYNLGNALRGLGRREEAVASYRSALSCDPKSIQALTNLGLLLRDLGRHEESVEAHADAARLDPASAECLINLGSSLLDDGKPEAALLALRRAALLKPEYAAALYNQGLAHFNLGHLDEAIACHRAAIALKPDMADAHANLGQALVGLARFDDAMACFDRATSLSPDNLDANLGRARASLLAGRLKEGWEAYEWRWRRPNNPPRRFPQPIWDGSPLDGRRILLYPEQGLGDTIQFVRYAPKLAELGARVVLECQPPLLRLFSGLPGVESIVSQGGALPNFDVHLPFLSLPRILGTELATIPAAVPYLPMPPAGPSVPAAPAGTRLRIGISWAGNPKHQNDRFRSCPLALFLDLAAIPGVALYSLQVGPAAADIKRLGLGGLIPDLGAGFGDFAETAAAVTQLDLVIAVDTAIVHLAGALAWPTWVILPQAPDWRWLEHGDRNPWYPTLRLWRQERLGDWPPVFARMAAALGGLAEARRHPS